MRIFETPQGKEIMRFLEHTCGWYRSIFSTQDRDIALINDGRRQVVATLKTLLTANAEQITALAKQQKES
jgi:hypothetical protein